MIAYMYRVCPTNPFPGSLSFPHGIFLRVVVLTRSRCLLLSNNMNSGAVAGTPMAAAPYALLIILGGCLTGCRELGISQTTERERYSETLKRSGLSGTALGIDWERAGDEALDNALLVSLPYKESGFFPANRAEALGLRVHVVQGQRLMVQVQKEVLEPARVFLDVFTRDSAGVTSPLVSADSGLLGIEIEIERSGEYLVRIQPELLRAVRYTLTLRSAPALGFPVQGADNSTIRSRFGVDRDAGRRRHEGIDIFAPKGTPVIAATRGRITSVGENGLGGLVVWEWDDERNQSLYYAHLSAQIAREGTTVERGDTIGLVGNTGNARTTPSHLHFGIYRRGEGAIDPLGYVFRSGSKPLAIRADTDLSGQLGRVTGTRVAAMDTVLDEPVRSNPIGVETVVRIHAAVGDRYRVELPDGANGFLLARQVEGLDVPLRSERLAGVAILVDRPADGAIAIGSLPPGRRVSLLGRFGNYRYARTEDGIEGWLPSPPSR